MRYAGSTAMYTLSLDGPGKNALSTGMMESIISRLREASGEPVLLIGTGDAFSAGLDLKEVAGLDRAGAERFLGTLEHMAETLFNYPAPVVACVNGHAIAGGCIIVLCADHRVVADQPRLRIGLNEVALGVQFPPQIFAVARHRLPPRAIERVILEAGLYDPQTALTLGIVDEVAADAPAAARARLEALARHPREAYVATKRALRAGVTDVSEATQRWFRDELVPSWVTPAVKERVTAVLAPRRS
jgi:Delta3-Delta2-enoyl-CoA isomerase